MKRKLMNVGRAAAFGWRAKTSLEEGLALSYAYYLSRL
jgi:GDP-L-fucose synthase